MVTAVILAAGAGRRMGGRPKALLTIDGETFLERVAGTCRRAGVTRLVVVTRADPPDIGRLARSLGAVTVQNPQPERGMFSSVRLGIAAAVRSAGLEAESGSPFDAAGDDSPRPAGRRSAAMGAAAPDPREEPAPDAAPDASPASHANPVPDASPTGLLIFPVDHPRVTPETVTVLMRTLPDHPADAWLRPVCEGRGGHPVLLAGAAAIGLLARDPAEPLRDALRALGLAPQDVPVDDPGILANLNRPGDLG